MDWILGFIHPSILFHLLGSESWEAATYPTSHRTRNWLHLGLQVTGQTQRDRQQFMYAFTLMGNLELSINPTLLIAYLWTVELNWSTQKEYANSRIWCSLADWRLERCSICIFLSYFVKIFSEINQNMEQPIYSQMFIRYAEYKLHVYTVQPTKGVTVAVLSLCEWA